MVYYERTKDSFYRQQEAENRKESLEEFQQRVEHVGDREFSGKELKKLGEGSELFSRILKEENARWKESGGLSADQRLSAEDIKKRVDREIQKEAGRISEKKGPEKSGKKMETARYRRELLSKTEAEKALGNPR